MAKGDVICVAFGAASYQPAAGVEVCITSVSNTAAGGITGWRLYDGATIGRIAQPGPDSATLTKECSVKVFITNALYINTGSGGCISGVQVK